MQIKHFYDKQTGTFSYVVTDTESKQCAIIDSVLNLDLFSGKISKGSADEILAYIKQENLQTEWILDTHIHADHLSAIGYLKNKLNAKTGINQNIKKILETWLPIFNTTADTPNDGSQFDHLFHEDEEFKIGNLSAKVLFTPGHTPACSSFFINNEALFVGDLIFMPHGGTARADFPGGSAESLYDSLQKIFALPDEIKIYTCHDYPKQGETEQCQTTIGDEKRNNVMIRPETTKAEFIEKREARDKTLAVPKLLLPSIQVNMRAGKLGKAEENDIQYLKIPINQF